MFLPRKIYHTQDNCSICEVCKAAYLEFAKRPIFLPRKIYYSQDFEADLSLEAAIFTHKTIISKAAYLEFAKWCFAVLPRERGPEMDC
jgi:hypothetical protein